LTMAWKPWTKALGEFVRSYASGLVMTNLYLIWGCITCWNYLIAYCWFAYNWRLNWCLMNL
jgi:hypothetical protein